MNQPSGTEKSVPIPRFLTSAPPMYRYTATRSSNQYPPAPQNLIFSDLSFSVPEMLHFPITYPRLMVGITNSLTIPSTSSSLPAQIQPSVIHSGNKPVYSLLSSPYSVSPPISMLRSPKPSIGRISRVKRDLPENVELILDPTIQGKTDTSPSPGRATRPTSLEPLKNDQVDSSNFSIHSPKRLTLPLPRFTESPVPIRPVKIKGQLVGLRVAELEQHIQRQSNPMAAPEANQSSNSIQ